VATELHFEDDWFDQFAMPAINQAVMKVTVAVRDDARKVCPVDTGALKASLVALNSGIGQGRVASHMPYAAAVELGFNGVVTVRAHMRNGHPVREHTAHMNTPAQPYLRPSLYRKRDLGDL